MKSTISERRRDLVLGLGVATLLVSTVGCATGPAMGEAPGTSSRPPLYEEKGRLYVRWTEEVQLSDGRVIVAERSDEYRKVTDHGQGWGSVGWLYQRGSFKATLPEPVSRTVSWEGTLKPLVIDMFAGSRVYFVGAIAAGFARDEWKLPDGQQYVVFRLDSRGWQRVELQDLPEEGKPTFLINTRLFFEGTKPLLPGSLIELRRKTELNANPQLPKSYRTIIRSIAK